MAEKFFRSKCCHAEVKVAGIPDAIVGKTKLAVTFSYACLKCNKPCDVIWVEVLATVAPRGQKSQKRMVRAAKPKMVKLNLLDGIEFRLTKEGRKIYDAYRKKYRHNPLKKTTGRFTRVAFWEFMHIFGSRIFHGAENIIVGNVMIIPNS